MAGGNESGGSGGGGGDAETTNAALRSWEEVLGPRIQAMLGGGGGGEVGEEEGSRAPGVVPTTSSRPIPVCQSTMGRGGGVPHVNLCGRMVATFGSKNVNAVKGRWVRGHGLLLAQLG